MIKMIIKMNDEKISSSNEYSHERIYSALDRIFAQKGMDRKETEKGVEYSGSGKNTDFAYFGKIMLGLKKQPWFMDNVSEWLFCNSDDSDDPNDFNTEDLLVHYGRKASVA